MPVAYAAGIAAVGGIAGSVISGSAAQSAANTQAGAANQATKAAQQQFQQTEANLSPFLQSGQLAGTALSNLSTGMGQGGAALTGQGISSLIFDPTQATLAATPGYQFDLNQGLNAVQNGQAAQGLSKSGSAVKAAAQYATGLANNTLTTQQGIFQQNLGNVINPLEFEANLGENAGAQTGQQGVQATQNANQALIGGANAQAAGTVGAANAAASGLSTAGNAPLNYALYNQILGGGGNSATANANTNSEYNYLNNGGQSFPPTYNV